eukprot:2898109-Amphidinium_carterae.2
MPFIWLASDLVSRTAGNTRQKLQGKRKRVGTYGDDGVRDQAFSLHGIAVVSAGTAYTGPLTAWPRDVWMLHMHYKEPLDAYTLNVTDVFEFHEPVDADLVVGVRGITAAAHAKRRICTPVVPESTFQRLGVHEGQNLNLTKGQQRLQITKGHEIAFEDFLASVHVVRSDLIGVKAVRLAGATRKKLFERTWPWLFCLGRWSGKATPLLDEVSTGCRIM